MKKGQITTYAIIAILVIASAAAVLYAVRGKLGFESEKAAPLEVKPLADFVGSCVEKTAKEALVFAGQRGGYYTIPENSAGNYVYYAIGNTSYLPDKTALENELSLYINDNLPLCTGKFSDFPEFQIETSAVSTKTKITDDRVKFEINYPITATRLTTYFISTFSANIPLRLDNIYEVSKQIVAEEIKGPGICMTCLIDLGIEEDVSINLGMTNSSRLFILTDNQNKIDDIPYNFIFITHD